MGSKCSLCKYSFKLKISPFSSMSAIIISAIFFLFDLADLVAGLAFLIHFLIPHLSSFTTHELLSSLS